MSSSNRSWGERVPICFVVAYVAAIGAVAAAWPILRTDTDIWYHLTAGRFMAETGAIPLRSFFSFLTPGRELVDYYWLFQSLVYRTFSWGGYGGLVALRSVLWVALAATVAALAFSGVRTRAAGRQEWAWPAFLTVLVVSGLMPRCLVLRPHLPEYLLIALFLLILDAKPKWAPILPLLAVLWGNLHGVSYPVLLWVCGSFVVERLFRRAPESFDQRAFAFGAVAMACVFVTPFGPGLLDVPFAPMDRARHQIRELQPIPLYALFSVEMIGGALSNASALNLLLGASLLAALGGGAMRKARPAHLLLFAGGLLLLTRGYRFFNELALLALPLARDNPPFEAPKPRSRAVAFVVGGALMAGAFIPLWLQVRNRPAYPVSFTGLPAGVTEFLKREGGGGKLLHHPDVGGFYEWELYPQYRIAMDMQMPFLFTEDDFFLLDAAFRLPPALKYFVERYHPEFIAAYRTQPGFRELIMKFPTYVPVFVDGNAVLYADASLKPELAKRWKLPADPYELFRMEPSAIRDPAGLDGCQPKFIARMLAAAPRDSAVRFLASRACLFRGDPAAAAAHARSIIAASPELGMGHLLLAESLEKAGDDRGAIGAYRRALARGEDMQSVRRRIADAYRRLGMTGEAEKEDFAADPGAPKLESADAAKTAGTAPGSGNPRVLDTPRGP